LAGWTLNKSLAEEENADVDPVDHDAGKAARLTPVTKRRPRSQPPRWRRGNVPRHWRRRLAPDPQHRTPAVSPTFSVRARRLLWSWWPWGIATLWALVTDRWGWATGLGVAAWTTYLATPTEGPPRFGLDHEFSIDSEQFLSTIAGATGVPFEPGNRVDLLNNGDEFYPSMLDAIARATNSVTIEAYIYWAGDIGVVFARALAKKAREGVPVKILLDAIGCSTIGSDILEILEGGRCHLAWYHPIRWYSLGRFNHRTHRKSLIVDGRVGFTGGAGIADHWLGHAEDSSHWRDMQARIEGPAVMPLQFGFAQHWLETTGELVSGEAFYPIVAPAGPLRVQTIMSSPETGASSVRIMYYLSIACARRSIYIANPYFIPDQVAIQTLVDARKRGVDVKIMVSGIRNDNWLARMNSVRLMGPLLDHDIEMFEYNRTMLHHKTMVVDGIWATVGTTNFDNRSFAHNDESNVCIHAASLAQELQKTLLKDLSMCERVDRTAWRRRGGWSRCQEFVAALFEEQA
jgi:cardiolipin synthase A/B